MDHRVPKGEELLRLDSFDLSFLILTGRVKLAPPGHVLGSVLKKLKDVRLWGPEAAVLGSAVRRAWRDVAGGFLRGVIDQFDQSGNVSVDRDGIEQLFRENDDLGQRVWERVRVQAREAFAKAQERSHEHFAAQRKAKKVEFTQAEWDAWLLDTITDKLAWAVATYPTRLLHPEVQRLVSIVQANPEFRLVDLAQLQSRIDNLVNLPETYLHAAADVHVGRVWSYTGLQTAVQNNVAEYAVVAVWDDATCPVCESIAGKTFSVESAYESVMHYLDSDSRYDAQSMPFPRIEDLDNKSPEQVRDMGLIPPFHGRSYAGGTELYTNEGWKRVEELTGRELFLSPNPEDDLLLEWVPARRTTVYDPGGSMVHFHSQNFDLLVTGNHEQICSTTRSSSWETVEAEQLIGASKVRIPRTGVWDGEMVSSVTVGRWEVPIHPFLRFMAYWLSDGSVVRKGPNSYYVTIAKRRHRDQLLAGLVDFPIRFYDREARLEFNDTDFGEYLSSFGHAPQKFIPDTIKRLPPDLLRVFLEAYLVCDGNETLTFGRYSSPGGSARRVFYTTSKRMADDLGELILKVGGYPSYILQEQAGTAHSIKGRAVHVHHDVWRIYWNTSRTATFGRNGKGQIELVPYEGMAYCVELERNHVLWVRRNGKTCFSGNCRCDTVMLWASSTVEVGEG